MTGSFYTIHKDWVAKQEWSHPKPVVSPPHDETLISEVEEVTEAAPAEETVTTSGTSSPGSDDEVIVINGKTYTKSELKKLLE